MAVERLYIENTYIPLTSGLNPSINKAITDISDPSTRKATYSKTVSIPRSKEADKIFSHYFEFNAINRTFNVNAKAAVRYEVDSEVIINGFLKLNEIKINDFQDITYDCTMYSEVADFFADIKELYMVDLYTSGADPMDEGMDKFNHALTKQIQEYSWDNQIWYDGAFIPFDFGTGYVYPLIDYGLSSNSLDFTFTQIGCALYVREIMRKIIYRTGRTYTSAFMDGTIFEHLIIPSSPDCYQLTSAEIATREFAANTPEFTSTGTTTTGNLPNNTYSANDTIIFTNEVFDTGLNYDPVTGEWTCVSTGVYDINAILEINATFTPGTLSNVKTRCEVDGFIEMYHTPISTGTPVVIAQQPFYISKNDTTFYSGVRSTSSTPTYEDKDYLIAKHWSIFPNDTSLTGRIVDPPDQYQIGGSAYPLNAGDIIHISTKAGLWHKSSTSGFNTDFFVDNLGTYYTGTATITCTVGSFYNKVANTLLQEGNTLTMDKVLPAKIKQTDFFTSICKKFNLWIDIDPANPYNLIIEPRDSYLGGTVKNIHELIDRSKDMIQLPMASLDAKQFYFADKPDADYWNKKYENDWQSIYGDRTVDVDSEFLSGVKKIETIFSPTTMVAQPNSDLVLPTIEQFDQTGQPISTKHNIRLLYYAGLKPTTYGWNHINYILSWPYLPLVDTYVEYPYAGHWDDPYTPTLDINWGLIKEVYYDDNINTINTTDNNLVNKYYGKHLREITDEDSRIVKAYVHLRPLDYVNFTFDKKYYFDYAYFRLQSIEGYNPTSEETTLCTFFMINAASDFTASTYPVTGATPPLGPVQSGGNVTMAEDMPAKPSQNLPDGNTGKSKTVTVQGEGNLLGQRTQYVEVYGNYNRVFSETTNIKINGSNNIITAGLENVTLINTNGVTVTESNVTYINGVIVGSNPTDVQLITASQNADISVRTYLIDASAGAVDLTFDIPTTNFVEGQTWFIKAVDITNTVRVVVSGGTIDGNVAEGIGTVDDGIEIQFYDGNFYIVSNKNTGGSGGAFTSLSDVPASYAGASLQVVRVNVGETGLEFATISGSGLTQEQVEGLI